MFDMALKFTHPNEPTCPCQGEPTGKVECKDNGYVHEYMCVKHGTLWNVPEKFIFPLVFNAA